MENHLRAPGMSIDMRLVSGPTVGAPPIPKTTCKNNCIRGLQFGWVFSRGWVLSSGGPYQSCDSNITRYEANHEIATVSSDLCYFEGSL